MRLSIKRSRAPWRDRPDVRFWPRPKVYQVSLCISRPERIKKGNAGMKPSRAAFSSKTWLCARDYKCC